MFLKMRSVIYLQIPRNLTVLLNYQLISDYIQFIIQKLMLKKNLQMIDEFIIQKMIGGGASGKVYLGSSQNQKMALKKFSIDNVFIAQKEFLLMQSLNHKNILKVYQFRPNSRHIYSNGKQESCAIIIMEFAQNGEIFDLIDSTGEFSEKITRTFFKTMIQTIEYLHNMGVAHLDIKLENLLLDENFDLKFIDFGFSTNKEYMIDAYVGTCGYMAPEIESQKMFNPFQADLFACGVVLFMMKTALIPFRQTRIDDIYYYMLNHEKKRYWAQFNDLDLSENFKDLIQRMLCKKIEKRMTIPQIKEHPWYKQEILSRAEFQQILQRLSL